MRHATRLTICLLLLGAAAGGPRAGALLEPIDAPEWEVSRWLNSDPGPLSSLRGKVVLIEFFQLWCPGSNRFSLPLFETWQETFADRDDVVLVSIHSVFEAHEMQTPQHLEIFVRQRGITRPVGIDAFGPADDEVPLTMNRFNTGGTPHVVIVDRAGQIRFSHFGSFDVGPVEAFIERLLDEKGGGRNQKTADDARTTRGRGRAAATRGGARTTPAEPAAPPREAEPKETELDLDLSGTYTVTVEQSARTCGDPEAPQQLIAELMVYPDRIDVRSVRPLLGLRKFTVQYDPGSGAFQADLNEEVQQGNAEVKLNLRLDGRIDSSSEPVVFEYQYTFDKRSTDVSLDCFVEGRGSGRLAKSRRD